MPFIKTPSGVEIHYESNGEGRPIVFIHGWSMSGRVWKYQAEALSSSYRVIVMDLRGHGESSAGPCSYTLEDFASDTAELFEQLDLRNAVLTGWSMGAEVALKSFPILKERLAALVLVSGTPRFTASDDYPHGLPAVEARGMSIRLKRNYTKTMGEFFQDMFAEGELSGESYQRIARDIVMGGKLPERGTALATLDRLISSDLRPLLPEIDVPVLLVHGSEDTITLPGASWFMAGYIPNVVLEIMDGTGHAPFLSRPGDFNSRLCSFLERIYASH
jgi:pimeloyl-ACP methyl ester esterase